MSTLGIIGGIAPESTIEYYRLVVAGYRASGPSGHYPSLIINSIDLTKLLNLIGANDLAGTAEYLAAEVRTLARAGADFGLLASNTPHIVFEEVQRMSPIPLLSIVEACCQAAKTLGLGTVGLLGARFTMQGRFYPDVFSREGIRLMIPEPDDQAYVHEKYMSELIAGVFLPETRDGLEAIVGRLRERTGIEGVILGGTELPLILRAPPKGLTFLDTTRIHAERAVAEMLA